MFRKAFTYFKFIFECVFIVAFFGYGVFHWGEIDVLMQRMSLCVILLAAFLYSSSHLFAAGAAKKLFFSDVIKLRYLDFLNMQIRNLPAKYIPGGIWQTVGRGGDLVGFGFAKKHVIKILLAEQVLAVWWAGFLGFFLAAISFRDDLQAIAITGVFIFMGGALLSGCFLARARASSLSLFDVALSPVTGLFYVAGWGGVASAFVCYIWLGGLIEVAPLKVAASYLVSWMLGAIAVFAPQGMGVFELAMKYLLAQSGNKAEILWLIGSYRLVVLAADAIVWCAWIIFRGAYKIADRECI